MKRCPQCGYTPPTGKKRVVKIYMASSLEKKWDNFCKEFDTREQAFEMLLKKAGILTERVTVSVEASIQ